MDCHFLLQCMKVKSESEAAQSCPTLSDPMQPTRLVCPWDFPGKSTGAGCHCLLRLCHLLSCFSHVRLLATPWTAAHQTPLSMGFSRQEYWSGVPLPSPFHWLPMCFAILSAYMFFTHDHHLPSVSHHLKSPHLWLSLYKWTDI